MKTFAASRWIPLAVSLLSAVAWQAPAQVFNVLHTFSPLVNSTNSDGATPWGGLIFSGNTLYGTAEKGGGGKDGTTFKLNTDGTGFTVLHTFTGCSGSDGSVPYSALLLSGDTLYGTTAGGCYPNLDGIVFSQNTNGSGLAVLYGFPFSSAGAMQPYAGLVASGGFLYGTTPETVFAVSTNGTAFTTLYTFSGTDGHTPYSRLALSGNTLYGSAPYGGVYSNGTVFTIHTDGSGYAVLHNFSGMSSNTNSDGANPFGNLVLSGDTLYGAATSGGGMGAGTLFAMNTNGGAFRVLHTFLNGSDGAAPNGLLLFGGTLYGSAEGGGTGPGISGKGTLYSINTTGTGYRVLYSFTQGDGPLGELVLSGNTIYGTTLWTTGYNTGNGIVYSVLLLPQLTVTRYGRQVVITWPTNNATGFTLLSTTNLISGTWTTNSPVPVVVNGINTVTNVASATSQFYRLRQ